MSEICERLEYLAEEANAAHFSDEATRDIVCQIAELLKQLAYLVREFHEEP